MSSTPWLHQIPFFRITLSFVLGILISYNWEISTLIGVAFLVLGFFLLVFTKFTLVGAKQTYYYRWIDGIGIYIIIINIGIVLFSFHSEKTKIEIENKKTIYIGKIIDAPIEKNKSVMITAILSPKNNPKQNFKSILYLQKDSLALDLRYGEKLVLFAQPSNIKNNGNPNDFDYAKFLKHKGIIKTSYIPSNEWQKLAVKPNFSIKGFALDTRMKLLSVFKKYGITNNEYGIVAALTVGYKEALSPETKQSFASTGGSHVLAVSGLHVGIIYIALNTLLSLFLFGKYASISKQIIIITSIWLYAFICGLPPSVIRASIMISLICLSDLANKKSATYNAVFFSALCMLVYNPNYLFDVGFQLSFAAVLSILYFQPKIYKLVDSKWKLIQWMWGLTAVSLAAQIGTAPISIYYFHSFPNYFLLTNLLVIPAATIIIYLSIILLVTSQWTMIATFISWMLLHILSKLINAIQIIEKLPFASISNIWLPLWFIIVVMIILILINIYIKVKRSIYIYLTLILVICTFSIKIYQRYNNYSSQQFIVYNLPQKQAQFNLHEINGKQNIWHIDTVNTKNIIQAVTNVAYKNGLNEPSLLHSDFNNHFGTIHGYTYFVLKSKIGKKNEHPPIPIKFLFVYARNINMTDIVKHFSPEYIIFADNIRGESLVKLKTECQIIGCKYHSMNENGAFMYPL